MLRGPCPGEERTAWGLRYLQIRHSRSKSCFKEVRLHRRKKMQLSAVSSITLCCSHSSSPLAEGGSTWTSPSPWESDGLKGCQGDDVDLFCSFQPLFFLYVFENRTFQGKNSVSQHGMKFDGGLFGCFGREINPSVSFLVQRKLKCFLVLPTEGLKKHNHCQSPLWWQSSPLCQVQTYCFTCLPLCLVMVRPCRRLSSPKGTAEVRITFLVMHFQRAPALQRGAAHNEWGSSALPCVGDHCTPADVQGLPTDVVRAVAAHRSLSGAGRAGQSQWGSARYSPCQSCQACWKGRGGRPGVA